jgi:formylglycine-generating enzyme required for sulfatase activity
MTPPRPPAVELDIEQVLEDFEIAWRDGRPPSLEPLLSSLPLGTPDVDELVHDLITIDLEYRWRSEASGPLPARPQLEDYLRLYPRLGASGTVAPQLIAAEYKVRSWAGDSPKQEEFLARFPGDAERAETIRAELARIDAELAAEGARNARFALVQDEPAAAGTSVGNAAALLAALRQHQLLSEKQLEELSRDSVLARCADAPALAQELLARDWLTPYQANMLLRGRGNALIVGPYVLLARLGEGAMGHVYKARHQYLGRIAALKVFRKGLLAELGEEGLARFYQEVEAAGRLAHPHVVHAYDAGPAGAAHFLAMEYHESIDLARLVNQVGPLPIAQACDYLRQAALGLQHAHERGLVHRDIKPSNLLVALPNMWHDASPPGASVWGLVKILDLGLARLSQNLRSSKSITLEGHLMGTPDYMAPEQADDPHNADIRADLYSLGCTFCFMLTGQPPFPGGNFLQKVNRHRSEEPLAVENLRQDVPEAVLAVQRRLLAKRPEDRFQTPAALAEALQDAGVAQSAETFADLETHAGESSLGVAAAAVARTPPPRRWRRLALAAVAVVAIVLSVGTVLSLGHLRFDHREKPAPAPVSAAPPRVITNSIGMKLALIPAGEFVMGSPPTEAGRNADEGPQHRVTISRPFYMGVFEVTQEQYEQITHRNPSRFNRSNGGGPNHPVETVSWNDAVEFCRKLSALASERRAGRVYRLPTEAEWEYAARAGTSSPYFYDVSKMDDYAWHTGNSGGKTHEVGRRQPNPWGLYDISGNVWEWCADYKENYPDAGLAVDPSGPKTGSSRVFRGGCWMSSRREWLRTAHRSLFGVGPERAQANIGFRVVCDAPGKQ